MERTENIIIEQSLGMVGKKAYDDYLSHALCTGGSCKFLFNGKEFELHKGDVMIVRKGKLMEKIYPSEDFKVINILVRSEFIAASAEQLWREGTACPVSQSRNASHGTAV